ncbi:hypothetical protein KKG05_06080 [bacterium]|nr:hypothetical protein [bacterium]MBU1936949.1 hypothetical protein [bacterium]
MKKAFLYFMILLFPALLIAQPQSENFMMTKQVLDAGGAYSTSENFQLTSAYGQPSPIGVQSSESFNLSGGFLSPMFEVSPLSPIQELVIIEDQPDVILHWERIDGAISYKIYRSDDPMFTPEPINEIGTAPDTTFTDVNAALLPLGKYFYNVTASSEAGSFVSVPSEPHPVLKRAAQRTAPRTRE